MVQNKNYFFYFKLLVREEFLGEILQRSNEYARPVIDSNCPLRYKSILNKWNEVTLPEIKKFFGLVFHMGLIGMPSIYCVIMCTVVQVSPLQKWYVFFFYVQRKILIHNTVPPFSQRVSTARWSLEVRFLINHLNNTMSVIYTPHKDCLWISLWCFRGIN